jgi:hypothetical protein
MTEPFPSICVNWAVYDVPAIWAMVGPEREWVSREQTSAWLRTSEMLAAHQSNLQLLRDRVAQYWSPESSAASRALIKQLDSLIHSVTAAAEAARTNATAVSLLTDALMEAKARVEPLHDAWGAAATDAERARLNKQAWVVMSEADSRVIEHGSLLQVPSGYVPPSIEEGTQPPQSGQGRIASATRPAIVPPLSDTPTRGAGPSTSSRSSSAPAPSHVDPDNPSQRATSPVLAGGGTPPAGQAAGSGNGVTDPPTPRHLLAPPSEQALSVRGVISSPPAVTGEALGMRGGFGGIGEPERIGRPSVESVIGGRPSGAARAGQTATSGATEPMQGGLIGGGLGVGGSRSPGTQQRRYPAEEEWEVPTGVEPVIELGLGPEPDPKIAFDPGPNVIGLRR